MKIKSLAFENGQEIPEKYSANSKNISPPLEFTNIPPNTASLSLIVDDPDAPHGTFTHWIIWNLPSNLEKLDEDAILPENSIEGITSWGTTGYNGPKPPSGTHRYFFKLYALDITFPDLQKETDINEIIHRFEKHKIDYAEMFGIYSKK